MAKKQHTAGEARSRAKIKGEGEVTVKGVHSEVAERTRARAFKREGTVKDEKLRNLGVSAFQGDELRNRGGNAFESNIQAIADLLGGPQTLGSAIESELEAHELLHRGLPRAALSNLVDKLHIIGVNEASEALGMSVRTLQRHKTAPVVLLDAPQSGRTWKFAEILAKATRVLGSQDEAEQWLKRPAIGLDQRRPVDLLTTPAGVKLVEDYLGRLEYGVYT
jgi:putative toxin-antitoxin system antitoxin component (TIGR02293 family)